MTAALFRWLCLSLCYFAFAGSLSKAEGIAAVLTGAVAAILSIGLRLQGERRLSLRGPVFAAIDRTHDGVVGDYVAWILIGLALFCVSSAAALHAG